MCSKFTFLTASDSGVKKRGGVWSETGGAINCFNGYILNVGIKIPVYYVFCCLKYGINF